MKSYKLQIERNAHGMKRFSVYLHVPGQPNAFDVHGDKLRPLLKQVMEYLYGTSYRGE